jgi:Fe-S-cluster containining protein
VTSPALDCRACGACCRQIPDGTALVSEDDLVRWKRDGRKDILDKLVPGSPQCLSYRKSGGIQ